MLDADRNISIVPMSQVSTSAEGWFCVQPDRSWAHVLWPFADNSGEREQHAAVLLSMRSFFSLFCCSPSLVVFLVSSLSMRVKRESNWFL